MQSNRWDLFISLPFVMSKHEKLHARGKALRQTKKKNKSDSYVYLILSEHDEVIWARMRAITHSPTSCKFTDIDTTCKVWIVLWSQRRAISIVRSNMGQSRTHVRTSDYIFTGFGFKVRITFHIWSLCGEKKNLYSHMHLAMSKRL